MFHCLYYSPTINECKENLETVFSCFWATKNIVAPSSPSNFPVKLICWATVVFVCLDKYMAMSL